VGPEALDSDLIRRLLDDRPHRSHYTKRLRRIECSISGFIRIVDANALGGLNSGDYLGSILTLEPPTRVGKPFR